MMATPQEMFDVLFTGLLISDGAHAKDVKVVAEEAARILKKYDVSVSDEQLTMMPTEWRPIALSLLFTYFAEQCDVILSEAKSSAEMN